MCVYKVANGYINVPFCIVKEASDACLWLKAAGFPQYVQMFEGNVV